MERCPRPECTGTLREIREPGGTTLTCVACGRHPGSPPVQLTRAAGRDDARAAASMHSGYKRKRLGEPRFPGKRKR